MAWVAVAGAGASLLGGILGGKKQAKAQKAAQASQDAMMNRQLDQGDRQFDFTKQIYDENQARFNPIFDEMRSSMDDVQPDYGAIAGDINSGFASAQGQEDRRQRRYGIKPTDGASAQSGREFGIKRAAAHVGARSQARAGAKEMKYNRRANLYGIGQGIQSSNAGMVTNAMGNQQANMQSSANLYGDRADQAGQNSMADAAGWGQLAGSVDWGGIFNGIKGWGSTPASTGGGSMRGGI